MHKFHGGMEEYGGKSLFAPKKLNFKKCSVLENETF